MFMKAKYWLFTIFIWPLHLFSQGQWEAKYLRGFIIPHHQHMTEMMSSMNGFELSRSWKVDSSGTVALKQHKPIVGIGVQYFHLGKAINGFAYGISGYYEAGKKLSGQTSLRVRLSVGAGYLTEQFDIFKNPLNKAIGSHVNGYMQILSYIETAINQNWNTKIGIGLSHYSNGNWGMPNLGINLPGLVLGLGKKQNNLNYVPIRHSRGNQVLWEFAVRSGKRQMTVDDPKNIAVFMGELSWNYPHNNIRGWRGALNIFLDRTYLYEKFQPLPNGSLSEITEIALSAGHEYKINRIGFTADLGVYLYRPNDTKRKYYEALGLKYYVTSQLSVITRLKAHLTSADYFEWGVNYIFAKKQQSQPGFGNCFKWFFSGLKSVEPVSE